MIGEFMVGSVVGGMAGAISAYEISEIFPEPYNKIVLAGEAILAVALTAAAVCEINKMIPIAEKMNDRYMK